MVDDGEREVLSDGGVWSLRMKGARMEEKLEEEEQDDWMARLRVPDMWDVEFKHILGSLESSAKGYTEEEGLAPSKQQQDSQQAARQAINNLRTTTTLTSSTLYISNLHSPSTTPSQPIADQMHSITHDILSILAQHNLTPSSIAFTTILLRHMSDFVAINTIYSTLFTTPNPPARVTVACGDTLPTGIDVVLSLTAHISTQPDDRLGLHVQSRSYWAPANIGPYSQAISLPLPTTMTSDAPSPTAPAPTTNPARIIYIAGQIPLVPSSMTLVPGPFATEAVLALQHLWRIGRVMAVDCWASCVVFITAVNDVEAGRRARVALEAWSAAHATGEGRAEGEEDENEGDDDDGEEPDIDIAELSLRRPWAVSVPSPAQAPAVTQNPKTERRPLPNRKVLHLGSLTSPPCFVAEVAELPRGASVEWAVLGISVDGSSQQGQVRVSLEDDYQVCSAGGSVGGLTIATCIVDDMEGLASVLQEIQSSEAEEGRLVEVYITGPLPEEDDGRSGYGLNGMNVQVVLCRSVWDGSGERVYAAIRYRCFEADEVVQRDVKSESMNERV